MFPRALATMLFVFLFLCFTTASLASTYSDLASSEDTADSIVDEFRHKVLWEDPKSSLETLLDDQDNITDPGVYTPPPPPPPPPAPITLVRSCAWPSYRLQHGNDTCRDWVKTCVAGDYSIRTRLECNGYSLDPISGYYLDPACENMPHAKSLKIKGSDHCEPWKRTHYQRKCRDKDFYGYFNGPKKGKFCRGIMESEADAFHNSKSPFWRDPRCGASPYRTLQHWELHKDHACRTWHYSEMAKGCRILGDKPGYKDSEFCAGTCMRDPDCPIREEARGQMPRLCRKKWTRDEFGNVCKALERGGDVLIKGVVYRL